MQRRQLLKIILPLGLITAGVVGGVSLLKKSACRVLDLPALLKHLKPFSDTELGKMSSVEKNPFDSAQGALAEQSRSLKHFDSLCEESFDEGYRQLVTKDFAEGKVKSVDGWLLSETEVLTHQLVYQSASHAN